MSYNFDSNSSPDARMRFPTEAAMRTAGDAAPAGAAGEHDSSLLFQTEWLYFRSALLKKVSEMGIEQQFIDVMREASPLRHQAIPAWLKFGDIGVSGDDGACV